jgi:hypothetical protein
MRMPLALGIVLVFVASPLRQFAVEDARSHRRGESGTG